MNNTPTTPKTYANTRMASDIEQRIADSNRERRDRTVYLVLVLIVLVIVVGSIAGEILANTVTETVNCADGYGCWIVECQEDMACWSADGNHGDDFTHIG